MATKSYTQRFTDCITSKDCWLFWGLRLLQCTTFTFLALAAANLGDAEIGGAAFNFGIIAAVCGAITIVGMAKTPKHFSITSIALFSIPIFFLMLYILIPLGQGYGAQKAIQLDDGTWAENGAYKSLGELAGEQGTLMDIGITTGAVTGAFLGFQGMSRLHGRDLQNEEDERCWWKELWGFTKFLGLILAKTAGVFVGYGWVWGQKSIIPLVDGTWFGACGWFNETQVDGKTDVRKGGLSSLNGFFSHNQEDEFSLRRNNNYDEDIDTRNRKIWDARKKVEALVKKQQQEQLQNSAPKTGEISTGTSADIGGFQLRRRLVSCHRLLRSEIKGNAGRAEI